MQMQAQGWKQEEGKEQGLEAEGQMRQGVTAGIGELQGQLNQWAI